MQHFCKAVADKSSATQLQCKTAGGLGKRRMLVLVKELILDNVDGDCCGFVAFSRLKLSFYCFCVWCTTGPLINVLSISPKIRWRLKIGRIFLFRWQCYCLNLSSTDVPDVDLAMVEMGQDQLNVADVQAVCQGVSDLHLRMV